MEFRLIMISAMYENGGNTVHRFLDGHPQLFVYPFESQLGTHLVKDHLSSMFPTKYRWPVFSLDASAIQDYKAIIDEECKVRSRTPLVSKFRHQPFDFSDDERCRLYVEEVERRGRSRATNVAAFLKATFEAWKDYRRSGEESVYVGYSPIVGIDSDKILSDFSGAHVLHVVRNPWSAYADTKKRPVPLSLRRYLTLWSTTQYHALIFQQEHPDRFHIVRFEDVVADPPTELGRVFEKMGLRRSDTLTRPTWNGNSLEEIFPWGTIRSATPDANRATAEELTPREIDEVRIWAGPYLGILGYENFI
jgi:hypothetical protein